MTMSNRSDEDIIEYFPVLKNSPQKQHIENQC